MVIPTAHDCSSRYPGETSKNLWNHHLFSSLKYPWSLVLFFPGPTSRHSLQHSAASFFFRHRKLLCFFRENFCRKGREIGIKFVWIFFCVSQGSRLSSVLAPRKTGVPRMFMCPPTWRIIPVSKWLVTPIYKPFRPFGRGTTLLRRRKLTMVINHLLTGMVLQVGIKKITKKQVDKKPIISRSLKVDSSKLVGTNHPHLVTNPLLGQFRREK